jgi:hypothetical protein
MSSNNVGHFITKTITTLQYFATLNHTSPHFTQLHFTTFIDTSLPLIYTLLPSDLALHIYNSYRSISPHITKLDTVQFFHFQINFKNNKPLHCPKELLTISLHFTFLFYFVFHLSYQPFTSLYFAINTYNSLPFIFTFFHLHFPSLVFTFLTLVLKICFFTVESPYGPFR